MKLSLKIISLDRDQNELLIKYRSFEWILAVVVGGIKSELEYLWMVYPIIWIIGGSTVSKAICVKIDEVIAIF